MGLLGRIATEFVRRSLEQMKNDVDENQTIISQGENQSPSSPRTVYFMGDVTEELVQQTIMHLITLAEEKPKEPIVLIISTLGGDVYDCFALYDTIKLLTCPIHTIGLGKIMSAGCVLLAAGDYRKIGANASLMYHAVWSGGSGNQWEQQAALIEHVRQSKQMDTLVAFETGQTIEAVESLYAKDRVDRYLTPVEAIAFGFADEIIKARSS